MPQVLVTLVVPSAHLIVDPDNAINSAPGPSKSKVTNLTIGKRKAPTQKSSRHVVQKTDHTVHTMTQAVHTSEDSNDDDNSDDDSDHMPVPSGRPSQPTSTHGKSTNIEASEDVVDEQEYVSLKAMADTDHEVSITSSSTSKIIHFTHLILRQFTESQRLMPLLMFAYFSDVIKSTRIQILQRSRMDIGASFACK